MRVLLILGAATRLSSSTSIANRNYIKGFVENGYEVDVITQKVFDDEVNFDIFEHKNVHYYEYETRGFMRKYFAREKKTLIKEEQSRTADQQEVTKHNAKRKIITAIKRVLSMLNYNIDSKWIRQALSFSSTEKYDLVVSSSFPVSSHWLASKLIKKRRIVCDNWIQLWQDPWAHCLYAQKYSDRKRRQMEKEEIRLLKIADKVVYVSPLTMLNQKKYYSEYSEKMSCVVLPSSDATPRDHTCDGAVKLGYFGDYFSYVRDIMPLYSALKGLDIEAQFVGDSDIKFEPDEKLSVKGRVPYAEVQTYEENSDVLIMLSNKAGGQIPGKVYYYAATNKIVLFIIDGTEEEKELLRSYFGKYDRYIFAENDTNDIREKLLYIKENIDDLRKTKPLDAFSPQKIVSRLIEVGKSERA